MNPTSYTVEIDPAAWHQLALLRVETYRRVREALLTVACEVTSGARAPLSPFPLVVDGTVAHCDVDHQKRQVLLREVAPPRPVTR
jgi:hypothetical protein